MNQDDFGYTSFKVTNRDLSQEQRSVPKWKIDMMGRGKPPKGDPPPPPTGTPVILLDFDGGLVTGTSWNWNGDINYAHANLTAAEQLRILDSIAWDYREFNVIVTMSDSLYFAAPHTKRMRLILTTTWEWYGSMVGGAAFSDSFTWGDNTPCWVFTSLLGYNIKHIQEAGSHEVGHTLGLRHQSAYDENCNFINNYNYGTASLAPIMGVAYYADRGEWWIGPNPYGCNNIQDDKLIISSIINYK